MRTEFAYEIGGDVKTVTVERRGDWFRVTIGAHTYDVRAQRPEHGRLNMQVGDRRLRVHVASDGLRRYVALAGQTWTVERPQPKSRGRRPGIGSQESGRLEAAMPGLVLDVLVGEGDVVDKGQTLVLLSAMKMELRIAAPVDGRVRSVNCVAGQVVERGQMLVEIEDAAQARQ